MAFLKRAMDKVFLPIFEATNRFHDQKVTMKKSFWQIKCACNLHPINRFSHTKKDKPWRVKIICYSMSETFYFFQFRFTSYFYGCIYISSSPTKVVISLFLCQYIFDLPSQVAQFSGLFLFILRAAKLRLTHTLCFVWTSL